MADEEIQAYQDALHIQNDCFDAWLYLGAAFLKTQRGSAADVKYIDAGGQLLLGDPEHIFYFSLGMLAFGNKYDAIATASQLKESSPELFREFQQYADVAI